MEGAEYLDLRESFFLHADDDLFIDLVHLTARGHELVADAIEACLAPPKKVRGGTPAGEQ